MTEYLFKTERLGIRKWRESDLLEFSKMGQDEKVMRYFPSLLSEQQTIDFVKRMQIQQKKKGYAYLPLEKLDNQEFIGMLGMADQDYNIKLDKSESIISEFVDIGWRLKTSAWGNGYATEGAIAWMDYGFEKVELTTIYSIAPIINIPSQSVMRKIGFEKIGVFNHPKIELAHPTRKCALFKKEK
ncbi:MAG: GNAT family N-acetyltransferase [Saprospiraceae bacterium]|nr:GNAT family N-acetyltransferase [Saprospiraceae bacterium]MDG2419319.1 GNAT family N-acetyltransferase [Saprospiraceae bacterium]